MKSTLKSCFVCDSQPAIPVLNGLLDIVAADFESFNQKESTLSTACESSGSIVTAGIPTKHSALNEKENKSSNRKVRKHSEEVDLSDNSPVRSELKDPKDYTGSFIQNEVAVL